ncbi:GNAT family N-acetyltransferase [Vulcaniibacterium tengchongense]|uniref:Acetyltransferase (GNAT) family protein n=1 Tax=Vulcaniibacterium tengchongense TaxID=1273429 RepID=A0A3N4V9F0_9GAMM|nr:GNAT family N-acetyltransferase [Vulcaniibacterium tengchongense]RPE79616.1 acetyltransferase (GNAT) family protein [Vulcaniibacterium tengchongense]
MGRAAAPGAATARIRAAEPGDAHDVARLLEALGYPCGPGEAAERIGLVRDDPRQHLLLAECEGEACGLVALYTLYSLVHGGELARITALVVAPERQREGLGRRLLREVEALARRSGIARIEATSSASRTGAHAFYRRCGYAEGSLRFLKTLGD